jgi:hypothetical protein
MAVKAQKAAADAAEEQVVNNTTETEKTEIGANTTVTEQKEETLTLVYIGPTLPAGKLKCNSIFNGTREEIKKHLETVMKEYPLTEKLLFPVDQLAEKKDKVKTAGNILNKYYSDIASSINAKMNAKEG